MTRTCLLRKSNGAPAFQRGGYFRQQCNLAKDDLSINGTLVRGLDQWHPSLRAACPGSHPSLRWSPIKPHRNSLKSSDFDSWCFKMLQRPALPEIQPVLYCTARSTKVPDTPKNTPVDFWAYGRWASCTCQVSFTDHYLWGFPVLGEWFRYSWLIFSCGDYQRIFLSGGSGDCGYSPQRIWWKRQSSCKAPSATNQTRKLVSLANSKGCAWPQSTARSWATSRRSLICWLSPSPVLYILYVDFVGSAFESFWRGTTRTESQLNKDKQRSVEETTEFLVQLRNDRGRERKG